MDFAVTKATERPVAEAASAIAALASVTAVLATRTVAADASQYTENATKRNALCAAVRSDDERSVVGIGTSWRKRFVTIGFY